ncbi:MAG: TIGR00341 family protein [Bacillota bacterium]
MELQMIEIYVPNKDVEAFKEKAEEFRVINVWRTRTNDQISLFKVLVEKQYTEDILDFLETEHAFSEELHAFLYDISTYLPRIDEEEQEQKKAENKEEAEEEDDSVEITRASRHELYNVVESASHFSVNYRWMLVLSSLIAAAGLINDSAAVVIGAMVIAPLIGPFTALSFAALLGDLKLMRRSLLTSTLGILIPLAIAIGFGVIFGAPLSSTEFLSRTEVSIMDIIIALAAGSAGALSFVKRVSEALVGVMVSVALLPPTVVLGMIIGAGEWGMVITPLLLVLVNIHAILLSAILVFWLTGIKPINWKEVQVASVSRIAALVFVSVVIVILAVVIFLVSQNT